MKSTEYSISVIVPVFNVESYIEACLNSLVNQTVPFDEIIIVNDGSEDASIRICKIYSEEYDNIILINQSNQGLSAARNNGIAHAKGRYLIFVDSDDYVDLRMCDRLKKELKGGDFDIIFYNACILNDLDEEKNKDQFIRNRKYTGCIMSGMQFFSSSFQEYYNVSACMAIYRKELIDRYSISFPKGLYFEDNFFFVQTVLNAQTVECINDQLYIRRCRPNSITTSAINEKKCMDQMEVHDLIWDYLAEYEKKEYYRSFYRDYISARMLLVLDFCIAAFEDHLVSKRKEEFIQKFLEQWAYLYQGENLTWNEAYLFCRINSESKRINEICGEEEIRLLFKRANEDLEEILVSRLRKLPFQNVEKRVGIYGIGEHTKLLLLFYQKYIGNINCDYYFIVTQKKFDEKYGEKDIVECRDIKENTDYIIISSLKYQKEMIQELLLVGVNEEKIQTLYNIGDKIDLVRAKEFLNT